MVKQNKDLLVFIFFYLISSSIIFAQVDFQRPEWTKFIASKDNTTTDEINFVGISYPTENLDDARYDALLNAGQTVLYYLNLDIDAYKEISSREGVCVEFHELNQIFINSSIHGALQVMSKIKLNEVYIEKESENTKNFVVFVNVSVNKIDLNKLRLSMAEYSARRIENVIEESEFLTKQRNRAAKAFRQLGKISFDGFEKNRFKKYPDDLECKTYLEQKKIEEEEMAAEAEKFWKEMMMK